MSNNLFGKASPEIPDNTGSEVEIFKGSFYHHYKQIKTSDITQSSYYTADCDLNLKVACCMQQ